MIFPCNKYACMTCDSLVTGFKSGVVDYDDDEFDKSTNKRRETRRCVREWWFCVIIW